MFDMCIESLLVKYLLKGITWLQMKVVITNVYNMLLSLATLDKDILIENRDKSLDVFKNI